MANINGSRPQLCPHGILGKRKCRECRLIWERNWIRQGNNREKGRKAHAAWLAANPNHNRAYTRKQLGIPIENGETRHGVCPLCDRERRLVPDHNHETGAMREWICTGCNLRLGIFESTKWTKFTEYVRKHGEKDNQ